MEMPKFALAPMEDETFLEIDDLRAQLTRLKGKMMDDDADLLPMLQSQAEGLRSSLASSALLRSTARQDGRDPRARGAHHPLGAAAQVQPAGDEASFMTYAECDHIMGLMADRMDGLEAAITRNRDDNKVMMRIINEVAKSLVKITRVLPRMEERIGRALSLGRRPAPRKEQSSLLAQTPEALAADAALPKTTAYADAQAYLQKCCGQAPPGAQTLPLPQKPRVPCQEPGGRAAERQGRREDARGRSRDDSLDTNSYERSSSRNTSVIHNPASERRGLVRQAVGPGNQSSILGLAQRLEQRMRSVSFQ